jgi:hypothetical protein
MNEARVHVPLEAVLVSHNRFSDFIGHPMRLLALGPNYGKAGSEDRDRLILGCWQTIAMHSLGVHE